MLSGTDTQECEIDVISDKEKQGLQYVVGHIFHKFYKKFRSKKDQESVHGQELLSILKKSAKMEEDNTQRLVNVKDRGGFLKVNSNVPRKCLKYVKLSFKEIKT